MVITLDRKKKPLGFCTERRARILMEKGRACVWRYEPFAIIIKDADVREMTDLPTFRLKIEPGAKYTEMAVICNETDKVMLFLQIEHCAEQVKKDLETRKNARGNRRNRETRYRRRKYGNRTAKKNSKACMDSPMSEGWPLPSVKSVTDNILSWTDKLMRLIRITECSFESVWFDTQLMDNPDIET